MANRSFSAQTRSTLAILGTLIQVTRKQRRMPAQELAERVGISRGTLLRIEAGDPGCEIGLVFEVATVLGIALYGTQNERGLLKTALEEKNLLLPSRARRINVKVDNDF